MEKIISIDLGTGFSAMSVLEAGKPTIIPNAEGGRTTPSIVAWTKTGERLVGQSAKRQAITNPENTVYEIKRFIGKKYDDCLDDISKVSYKVVKAPNGDCRVRIGDKDYSPEEISSFILSKLKTDAEAYLGLPSGSIKKAVITCPAYFSDAERSATKVAGQLAGLEVLRVLSEPVAASLYYGTEKSNGRNSVIGVVDCGSGTTDITIIEAAGEDGVYETKTIAGDNQLGGKDFDQHIMDWLIAEFKNDTGIDLGRDPMALQRLKDSAEQAKIALSTTESTEINIPFVSANENGPQHLVKTLTRSKFESITDDLVDRLAVPCRTCLAEIGDVKVDKVILVGGSTRIPAIQRKVAEIFGLEPSKDVNPDEAVSLGAAVQSGIITGEVKDILLLDATPLTLSICTNGQVATPMVPKNTVIPTRKVERFTNAAPMQSMATILIGQGERKMFEDNKLLGQFNVEITPCPVAGQAQIEVTYEIDANGILTVSAKDLALNKPANITITNSSGLSKDEIERAMDDARRYAEEDAKRVELVNQRNGAESLCNSIEKTLRDAGGKVSDDDRRAIETEVSNVREVLKNGDAPAIKTAMDSLSDKWNPVVSKLYQQQQPDSENNKNNMEFMNNFSNMFNGNPFGGYTPPNSQPNDKKDDGPIEAEVV